MVAADAAYSQERNAECNLSMPGFPNDDEYGDLQSHVVDAGK